MDHVLALKIAMVVEAVRFRCHGFQLPSALYRIPAPTSRTTKPRGTPKGFFGRKR